MTDRYPRNRSFLPPRDRKTGESLEVDAMNSARQRFEHPLAVPGALPGAAPLPTTPLPLGTSAIVNSEPTMRKVLIGTPTLGTVRMEWHNAMASMVIPCNWSNGMTSPIGFRVADAQNLIVEQFLAAGYDWLLLIEDDVIPPPDLFLRVEKYMDAGDVPIVSGLYHVKGVNTISQPMIYRGRGNGAYRSWKPGDLVWADGVPTGCLLVHRKVLQVLHDEAPVYVLRPIGGEMRLRQVFDTPRSVQIDMGTGSYLKTMGTSDLHFCEQVISKKALARAGWPDVQKKRYPFLVDTGIACGHIDRLTGMVF